ncbi:unnamed protein product [Parnassius apollo]|uniref:(apollo) hypothetical protein n=1 Tax=Parnassius apollo TaxID=110799 RepID=A0A8S3XWE7_PARAO|nr:unnamed protein product [Parnassius apollo]
MKGRVPQHLSPCWSPSLHRNLSPHWSQESRPEIRAEKPLEPLALEVTLTEQNPNGESSEPELDPELLEALIQDSVRDETLFGNKLSEKIKAARAIERQGLQIKKINTKPYGSQSTSNRSSSSGNWPGPPRYSMNRCNRGGKKTSTQSRRPYPSSTQQQPASKPSAANKSRAPAPQ